ncbi:MAG: amino acid permease [Pirellulales bacterium]
MVWWKDLYRKKTIAQIHAELQSGDEQGHALTKNLGLVDLVCFGVAAIIGAGIFSTIGNAAASGGPAVILLFILTAIACLFSALCYAEFASAIPISGSAYTYSYAAFGELIAWLIGWNLLMEYAIGNSVVAFSWSEYFTNVVTNLKGLNGEQLIAIPLWLQNDYLTCSQAWSEVQQAVKDGIDPAGLKGNPQQFAQVWADAPSLGGWKVIFDLPAMTINVLITALVYVGIKESKTVSNLMVFLKVAVVILVIIVGATYVKPSNWSPFAPNGIAGILSGIAGVFFAYIGFDAISTTAEECKNPKKDLPRATLYTLILCTILYIMIALVLTGMVSYSELGVSDPLAFVFEKYNLNTMATIVSLSAIAAITSVFLVFQLGQPRIWMSMARDGLLPPAFARIHPRFRTPSFSTVVTGIVVALPILFLNQALVTDLCSIGTLFAFMLVSAGVLALENDPARLEHATFRVPYINGKYAVPSLFALFLVIGSAVLVHPYRTGKVTFSELFPKDLAGWEATFPYVAFILVFAVMSVYSYRKRWSLIPVLGVLTNLYLIAGLGHNNWYRFIFWCLAGFVVYFCYGFWNSKLRRTHS